MHFYMYTAAKMVNVTVLPLSSILQNESFKSERIASLCFGGWFSCKERESAGLCPANRLQALHVPPKYCQLLFSPRLMDETPCPTCSGTDAVDRQLVEPIAPGPASLAVVYI